MAISRYRNVPKIDKKYYGTQDFPLKVKLDAISTINIVFNAMDRLDTLAFKHLGAGEYWWVIAIMNDIDWGLKVNPGTVLKIPIDIEDVLKLF
jgi:hypothetical protein